MFDNTAWYHLLMDDETLNKIKTGEKHFFVKHYPKQSSLVVLCDLTDKGLEIKSIHIRKSKKVKGVTLA